MKCKINDLFKLGLNNFKPNSLNIFNLLAPFINEIANILTLSNVINLYPHHPKNNIEIYKKAFIDLISLIGIVSNASHYSRYGYKLGILKGSVLIFLTFFIPNLFMDDFLSFPKNNVTKLILGFFIIYILEFLIQFIYCKVSKVFIDNDKELSKHFKKHHSH
mgnify:CR=1 FL=1|tara:strand:- start:310 stop:795 length:486 start_codon:yes stop_codon:yes gene_type:complete